MRATMFWSQVCSKIRKGEDITQRTSALPSTLTARAGRALSCRSDQGFRPDLPGEGIVSETIVWKRRSQPMQMMSPRAGLKEGSASADDLFGLANLLWHATRFARVTLRGP